MATAETGSATTRHPRRQLECSALGRQKALDAALKADLAARRTLRGRHAKGTDPKQFTSDDYARSEYDAPVKGQNVTVVTTDDVQAVVLPRRAHRMQPLRAKHEAGHPSERNPQTLPAVTDP